jgi:hypothetical protein
MLRERICTTCGSSIPTGPMPSSPRPWATPKPGSRNGAYRLREELAAGERLEHILQGHSRARTTPSPTTHPLVVKPILSIRDQPPEGLRRVPGPEAIHYYLERDALLQFFHFPVPDGHDHLPDFEGQ